MNKKIVYIRADANNTIGTGHMMRCMAIANAIENMGAKAIFIVADSISKCLVEESGFGCFCMDTVWNDMESELEILCDYIAKNNINKIFIDDYFVTKKYLQRLSKYTQIVYLDDLNMFIYPVSKVINYNIYANDFRYGSRYASSNYKTEFMLGTDYAPLRSEFQNLGTRHYLGIKKILITSGGTDSYNMIEHIVDALSYTYDFDKYELYCIVGRFNEKKDYLCKKYENHRNVNILYNVSNMNYYMEMCDLCITAGGTTIYELCACGIPSILYIIADNQIDCAKKMAEIKLIPCAGDARTGIQQCVENIVIELEKYKDKEYWENISCRMQNYVDGKGATRIAEELLK